MNPAGASPLPRRAWTHSARVKALPTHTVNITGFLSWWTGLSLAKAASAARLAMAGSNSGLGWSSPKEVDVRMGFT